MTTDPKNLALVFGGGGARAAYQAGFLRGALRVCPKLRASIVTGVSAGAINAAHLAVHPGPMSVAVDELVEIWRGITVNQVFRTDPASIASIMLRWALRLVSGGSNLPPEARGMVDSSPLRAFLARHLHAAPDGALPGIADSLAAGRLSSISITTTDYGTARSVSWIQGGESRPPWKRPGRAGTHTALTLDHVLASCALPLFFPAVRVGDSWHGDGGIQLTAPLSPALHLGARRIIAISTRYMPTRREAARPVAPDYPPPATILGVLLDSIFLDALDHDAAVMKRINELIAHLPPETVSASGLRPVDILLVRPSVDLSLVATEFERELPRFFRFATRGLGTRETRRADFLATLLFQPGFVARMIEIGERDAETRRDELCAFLECGDENETAPSSPAAACKANTPYAFT